MNLYGSRLPVVRTSIDRDSDAAERVLTDFFIESAAVSAQ